MAGSEYTLTMCSSRVPGTPRALWATTGSAVRHVRVRGSLLEKAPYRFAARDRVTAERSVELVLRVSRRAWAPASGGAFGYRRRPLGA